MAQSRRKTMSQVALNWCMCKGTIPIPGERAQPGAAGNMSCTESVTSRVVASARCSTWQLHAQQPLPASEHQQLCSACCGQGIRRRGSLLHAHAHTHQPGGRTSHPPACLPSGAKDLAQAQENLGALGWRLSAGEQAELDKAAARIKKGMVQNIFQTK